MKKRKTAGELVLKAANDPAIYNSLEVGYALTDDIQKEIEKCIERHNQIFDEPQYCVIMQLADDCMLKGIMRKKFYGYLFLPKPRPRQLVMLYNKVKNSLIRLWTLPDALTMSILSEMPLTSVKEEWKRTKEWVDWFYENWIVESKRGDHFKFKNMKPLDFYQKIRKQHGITLESEAEYLNANREKLIHAGCKQVKTPFPDPFDFGKISIDHIANTKTAIRN